MAAHCAEVSGVSSPNIGILIAVVSSLINGSTFVLQKKGMLRSQQRGGSYLRDVVWWNGTLCMIIGQIGNAVAYSMAPAVTVTPLGALGVLFGAVLAAWILKEHLNILGKLGCLLCFCGSLVLIIHAPKAKPTCELGSSGSDVPFMHEPKAEEMPSKELMDRLLDPVFVTYALLVVLLLIALIVWIAPVHGRSNVMVYVAICSLLGTFTVPSVKGLGLVQPEVFGDYPCSSRATILFLVLLGTLIVSILTQFFFINKALECFSSNLFEAIYYVTFTSAVMLASALLFKEWTALTVVDSITLLCGFSTACVGVAILRISHEALITWKKKEEGREKTD
ncbi:magnesium transporter NIPA1 [Stegastes partitus]|uniref:Magnesium transporter NIPA1 n=1 Tax=Stegastes partitus TaxID=144197 RepID=A0A3B5ALW2_9TELE|nr:PREDICTED: magnesium transporter NIPA1 [Stegastes partitus]